MSEFLSHPFLLVLVGGVLTRLLVPALARRWHTHQKELEIKIGLVSEVSESIMAFMTAIQVIHIGAKRFLDNPQQLANFQQDFTKAYRDWEVRSAVIGVKLQTYLPDTPIPQEWAHLSTMLEDFYALEGLSEEAIQTFAAGISKKLSRSLDGEKVGTEWDKIKAAVLKKKSAIIASILASRKLNIGTRSHFSWPANRASTQPRKDRPRR
jgi:hypothetical protein